MSNHSRKISNSLLIVTLLTAASVFAQGEMANPLGKDASDNEGPLAIKLRSGPGDPVAGREKSLLCQGCHGTHGNSKVSLIPKLAGQYAHYIKKEILNYQSGIRSHQIMNAMAGTLNHEQDIDDIAAYFASQTKMKGDGSGNPDGEQIFLHGDEKKMRLACVNCHGVRGKGLDPKIGMFPVLGGQHKDYIKLQLTNFRDGYRTNSPGDIMNRITNSLTDEQIEALAEYVSSQ